jgi:hypothetical protein
VKELSPLKNAINSGNVAAGPTVDAIIDGLKAQCAQLEFIRVQRLALQFAPLKHRTTCSPYH